MTFEAAYSQERFEQWTDVWPAVKHTSVEWRQRLAPLHQGAPQSSVLVSALQSFAGR